MGCEERQQRFDVVALSTQDVGVGPCHIEDLDDHGILRLGQVFILNRVRQHFFDGIARILGGCLCAKRVFFCHDHPCRTDDRDGKKASRPCLNLLVHLVQLLFLWPGFCPRASLVDPCFHSEPEMSGDDVGLVRIFYKLADANIRSRLAFSTVPTQKDSLKEPYRTMSFLPSTSRRFGKNSSADPIMKSFNSNYY